MVHKILFGIIGLLFVAVVVIGTQTFLEQSADTEGLLTVQSSSTEVEAGERDVPTEEPVTPPVVSKEAVEEGEQTFTFTEVQQHNSETSCYTVIEGVVYDLTPFINLHPGGRDAQLSLCGIDGTEAFLGKHGGSPKPEEMLQSLRIGVLVSE